ncbi:MAG: FAD-dependent oxidoreductase, partial [Pseudomonadota bacterium]
QLCHKYPKGRPGQTQILFAPSITLTLAMGPVQQALGDIDFQADAWFLDGFSPAKNPNMWTPQVMKQIGAHTKKGGSLSTFTVAGSVRRGLLEAGFDIEKSPGFGRKREMLKAVIPAPSSPTPKQLSSVPSVAIIGAGIGGVATAWHCQRYGMDVTLFDAEAPAAGASGNPIGLLMPRVEANDTPSARFFRDAFLYALQFYHVTAPEHIKMMGGTIAPDEDRPSRFVKLMSSHMWHKDDFHLRGDGTLFVTHGATLSPQKAIHQILGHGDIHVQRKRVTSIQQDHRYPVSLYSDENCVWHGDHVVIANGVHAHQFMKCDSILKASRGQIDIFKDSPPSHIITSGSYIAPF